ncbi:MAG TPA: hypothetical protein VIW93_11240 [Candidatus Acidoferrum sp.]
MTTENQFSGWRVAAKLVQIAERSRANGESDTVYSKDFGKLGKSYAKMLVDHWKKDKVIGKK